MLRLKLKLYLYKDYSKTFGVFEYFPASTLHHQIKVTAILCKYLKNIAVIFNFGLWNSLSRMLCEN